MPEDLDTMRGYMVLAESLVLNEFQAPVEIPAESEPSADPSDNSALLAELHDVVAKLRAHMEDGTGDMAAGVETGMQRAADMIERVLRSHGG